MGLFPPLQKLVLKIPGSNGYRGADRRDNRCQKTTLPDGTAGAGAALLSFCPQVFSEPKGTRPQAPTLGGPGLGRARAGHPRQVAFSWTAALLSSFFLLWNPRVLLLLSFQPSSQGWVGPAPGAPSRIWKWLRP